MRRLTPLILFSAFIISGCGGGREVVPGVGRIEKVEYLKHWITLVVSHHSTPLDIVSTQVFHGLRPNTTHETAVRLLGRPQNVRQERDNIYFEYFFNNSRLEIGRERDNDGASWSLSAYPKNMLYREALSPDAAGSFKLRSDNSAIQISDCYGKLTFLLVLRGSRIEEIKWFR